uniref:Importinlike protein putative n=1 Tax=Albugo laibachii Nc14 TaxID=890382 RepID=F0WRQ0_9STRA|nr:importinlike protein putative [Albugo laibachii Nc14]|eukprot:CCA24014.1 importinlike protein putative [Albugo laibachii Nc14]
MTFIQPQYQSTSTSTQWRHILSNLMCNDNDLRTKNEAIFEDLKELEPNETLMHLLSLLQANHKLQSTRIPLTTDSIDIRTLAAVLLRRILVKESASIWEDVSAQTQASVKTQLMQLLMEESNAGIRRQISEIVGELASHLLEQRQWNDFLPTLMEWINGTSTALRETALHLMERIACYLSYSILSESTDTMGSSEATLILVFQRSLTEDLEEGCIGLYAIRVFLTLMMQMEYTDQTGEVWKSTIRKQQYQQIVYWILNAMQKMAFRQNFDEIFQVMEIWIESLDARESESDHPFVSCIMKELLLQFVGFLVALADGKSHSQSASEEYMQIPDNVRQIAVELLVTLAEKAPSTCRKAGQRFFVSQVFPVAFRMMLELDDIDRWSVYSCEEELLSIGSNPISHFDVGSEALDRFAHALGPKQSISTCFDLMQSYVSDSENWLARHAALVGICQILDLLNAAQVDVVVKHIFAMAYDAHPRVCCTALDVIGQLSIDQSPYFQQRYHRDATTILSNNLKRVDCPRLQAHAATAMRQFIDLSTQEILQSYMQPILQILFNVLNEKPESHPLTTKQSVQEHMITVVSSIATIAGPSFAEYYTVIAPALESILLNCLSTIQSPKNDIKTSVKRGSLNLAGVALECITTSILAVGKSVFQTGSSRILEIMTEMQHTPEVSTCECVRTYLLQAWARCCQCLGQDFAPYLPIVMPPLLSLATQQAETEVDPYAFARDEHTSDQDIEFAHVNDKCISIQTLVLEEKVTACELLVGMVSTLKEAFFPFVEQTTQVLAPLLTDSIHSDIRSASVNALPALLECVISTSIQKHLDPAPEAIKQMYDFTLGRLVSALVSEPETELVVEMIHSIKVCMLEVASYSVEIPPSFHVAMELNHAQTHELVRGLLSVFGDTLRRRAIRRTELESEEESDTDEIVSVQETITTCEDTEYDQEVEIQFLLADCLGQIAKSQQTNFFQVFQTTLWENIREMSAIDCLPQDRKWALYILDDVLEFCPPEKVKSHLHTFVPLLLQVLQQNNGYADLIQAAAYGLGICACISGNDLQAQKIFSEFAKPTFDLLYEMLSRDFEDGKDAQNARDNVISAVGLLLEHHGGALIDRNVSDLIFEYLEWLPLLSDLEESHEVLLRLCGMIERGFFAIQKDCRLVLIRLTRVFAKVQCHQDRFQAALGDDKVEKLQQRMHRILLSFREAFSTDSEMQNVWLAMSEDERVALSVLLRN